MSKKLNEISGHKMAGLTQDLMGKLRNKVISLEEFEKFLSLSQKERRKLFGDGKQPENEILQLISGGENLKLDALSGKETIRESKKIFGWIDSDFKNYGADKEGASTGETGVDVHEMIKNATFGRIFGSFNTELEKLCLTQHQIINFIQKHRNWLRTEGYETFFLFKSNGQFFVAYVSFDDDGSLRAIVDRLERGNVWHAEYRHRLVVPQLIA